MSKSDWTEMRKFTTAADVENTKRQLDSAKKHGEDIGNLIPVVDAGEAVWSAEHSAYFVKCHVPGQVRKWNLALRNDNSAKRYMFDGGL